MGHTAEDQEALRRLAIAPGAGLGPVVGAVANVAAALGYDVEAELVDPDDQ